MLVCDAIAGAGDAEEHGSDDSPIVVTSCWSMQCCVTEITPQNMDNISEYKEPDVFRQM
jgi:hypothetical protein